MFQLRWPRKGVVVVEWRGWKLPTETELVKCLRSIQAPNSNICLTFRDVPDGPSILPALRRVAKEISEQEVWLYQLIFGGRYVHEAREIAALIDLMELGEGRLARIEIHSYLRSPDSLLKILETAAKMARRGLYPTLDLFSAHRKMPLWLYLTAAPATQLDAWSKLKPIYREVFCRTDHIIRDARYLPRGAECCLTTCVNHRPVHLVRFEAESDTRVSQRLQARLNLVRNERSSDDEVYGRRERRGPSRTPDDSLSDDLDWKSRSDHNSAETNHRKAQSIQVKKLHNGRRRRRQPDDRFLRSGAAAIHRRYENQGYEPGDRRNRPTPRRGGRPPDRHEDKISSSSTYGGDPAPDSARRQAPRHDESFSHSPTPTPTPSSSSSNGNGDDQIWHPSAVAATLKSASARQVEDRQDKTAPCKLPARVGMELPSSLSAPPKPPAIPRHKVWKFIVVLEWPALLALMPVLPNWPGPVCKLLAHLPDDAAVLLCHKTTVRCLKYLQRERADPKPFENWMRSLLGVSRNFFESDQGIPYHQQFLAEPLLLIYRFSTQKLVYGNHIVVTNDVKRRQGMRGPHVTAVFFSDLSTIIDKALSGDLVVDLAKQSSEYWHAQIDQPTFWVGRGASMLCNANDEDESIASASGE